jgi:hypothetical protein
MIRVYVACAMIAVRLYVDRRQRYATRLPRHGAAA